jgi:hypothetical protein
LHGRPLKINLAKDLLFADFQALFYNRVLPLPVSSFQGKDAIPRWKTYSRLARADKAFRAGGSFMVVAVRGTQNPNTEKKCECNGCPYAFFVDEASTPNKVEPR